MNPHAQKPLLSGMEIQELTHYGNKVNIPVVSYDREGMLVKRSLKQCLDMLSEDFEEEPKPVENKQFNA